jgi:hypothetical protein
VRTSEEQPKSAITAAMLQKAENRMLRTITGMWQRDRVRIKDLLERTNNMSVNQTASQIKLCEMWKASKVEDYPVKMEKTKCKIGERVTRQNKEEKFKEMPELNHQNTGPVFRWLKHFQLSSCFNHLNTGPVFKW